FTAERGVGRTVGSRMREKRTLNPVVLAPVQFLLSPVIAVCLTLFAAFLFRFPAYLRTGNLNEVSIETELWAGFGILGWLWDQILPHSISDPRTAALIFVVLVNPFALLSYGAAIGIMRRKKWASMLAEGLAALSAISVITIAYWNMRSLVGPYGRWGDFIPGLVAIALPSVSVAAAFLF